MPTIITSGLLAGGENTCEDSYKGVTLTYVYLVRMDPGFDPTSALVVALTTDGVPQKYSRLNSVSNILVTKRTATFYSQSSPDIVKIVILYEYDFDKSKNEPSFTGPCTLEVGTVMASSKVTRDAFGDDMILTFTDPNLLAIYNNLANAANVDTAVAIERDQPAEIDIQVPMPLITFRRREPLVGRDYVLLKLNYEGHINSRTFQHGAVHSWLMTLLEAKLEGDAYNVTYQFQYHGNLDPGTWDAIFFFKEPSGSKNLTQGAPAEGITLENGGIAIKQVYYEADFNQLGLYV